MHPTFIACSMLFATSFVQASLKEIILNNIDVLVFQETKIDETFPRGFFDIPRYMRPYRKDCNIHGGGILVYVRDIPSRKLAEIDFENDIEGLFIEINLQKSKLLLFATYKPPSLSKVTYFDKIGKPLDFYRKKYENVVLMGDSNTTDAEESLHDFLEENALHNLVKFSIFFKSVSNTSTIDLIITNKHNKQNTIGVSTGLSDFHKMVMTSMKTTFQKASPKVIVYRDMKSFDKKAFRLELAQKLATTDSTSFLNFENTFINILDKLSPPKEKTHRANQKAYVSKDMRHAILKRSELALKYCKNPTEENNKAF